MVVVRRLPSAIAFRKYGTSPRHMSSSGEKWVRLEGLTAHVDCDGDYRQEAWLEDRSRPLYSKQASMPRLPVPSLEETVQMFLPTALPLTESEQETESLVHACRLFPSQAATLQQRLLERKEEFHDSSWLQLWWNRLGYLQVRDSTAIHVSYFFRLDNGQTKQRPASRGAAVLQAATMLSEKILDGSKEADSIGKKHPFHLCSSQFKYLFHACRIPRRGQDLYRIYSPTAQKHAVVALDGHFHKMPLTDEHGRILCRDVLERLIQECIDSPKPEHIPELGWLTGTNRDDFADAYKILESHPSSRKALDELESAVCVLCLDLDGSGPFTDQQFACQLWHGNKVFSSNRWFDKSIQLIVNADGGLGYVGEHSMADGMPAVELSQYLVKHSTASKQHDGTFSSMVPYRAKLIFSDSFEQMPEKTRQELNKRVDAARTDLCNRIDAHDLYVQHFCGYGADRMKRAGFSPDAFVQVAMQVAGGRVYGKQVATYESTQTRRFLHGRTETTRSVNPFSNEFFRFMSSDSEDLDTKRRLLENAVNAHVQYIQRAVEGQGVDRHFLGLSMMLQEGEQAPTLLTHPAYLRSKRWLLSTSTLPNTSPGFGNVEVDGLGIGYDIRNHECIFTITGRKEFHRTKAMSDMIGAVLREMEPLLQDGGLHHSKL